MKHVMIDIETLGTKSNSVILSLGAVVFDLKTGKTYNTFYKKISIQSCLDLNMVVEESTFNWWMNQDSQAKRDAFNNKGLDLKDVLCDFSDWIDWSDMEVWGNSNRFDLGIIENAYTKVGKKIPWRFYNERDCRTLVSFNPLLKDYDNFKGTKHNALDDCFFQIGYCSKIYNSLKPA